MRKKFTMLMASLFLCMGMMAQVYQKIPHAKWTVTALNETPRQANNREGGVEFIKDENSATFYHSDWKNNYDGQNINKGKSGLQAFMIQMGESFTFDKITYAGRSDDNTSGWATKVRIYVYETLPETWPKDTESANKQLSALTYDEKEELLKREGNTVLGEPAFDNNETPWADDRTVKTAEFATPQTGKYILFVMDGGHDSWLTCSDFHIWQKVEGIVEDKAYYLKIKDLDSYYLDVKVGVSSDKGNTISKTTEPVCAYFTLNDGYWHISSSAGHTGDFVGVTWWDAIPGQSTPANWTIHKDDIYSCWYLAQSSYYGDDGNAAKHYLGANDGNITDNTKLYTDKAIAQAVKIVFEEAPVTQIVFNYYDGETKVNTVRKDFLINSPIAIGDVPTFDFYTDYTFKTTGDIVASEGASYDISCNAAFPFEIATIDGNGNIAGSWYKMAQGAGNIAYSYDNNRVNYVSDANADAKAYWAFVRVDGESNRFNIYNLGRPGYPMTAVANPSYGQYNQSTLHISGQATGLTDFMISVNNDGYNIQIPSEVISGNYATAGNHVGGFGFWSTSGTGPITSGASKITFTEVEVTELALAKSSAKAAWKAVALGNEFPNFATTFGGNEISSLQTLDAAIDAVASVDEVNSVAVALKANATKYYIRMYNAGRAAERTENWYASGSNVAKDGNASSLFLYDVNRNLQQVTTGNYLVHSTAYGQNNAYSLTGTQGDASVFTFTASTRVTDSWSVYDGFGYMCDWGNTNKVFSLGTKEDNWATWAVEFEEFPQAGFYTIAAGEKYVSDDRKSDSETQRVLTTGTPDAKNIFYYDGQALIGYANGYGFEYACCNTQTVGVMNHFMFINNGDGHYVKSSAGTSINGWADGFWKANENDYLERVAVANATAWTIAEVATLPVAVSAAGYATLYAPVALQVPAEGVAAHTVTVEGDKAILSEPLEVIPAETGVILVGEEGTHDFTVTTTDETVESALTGTFAKTYVKDESYVLANGTKGVGLYKASMNQQEGTAFLNNGFKAYLPATAVPSGAQALSFTRGGDDETTGIAPSPLNAQPSTAIYDLTGRRVEKMEKGIYIVNGKKVIK